MDHSMTISLLSTIQIWIPTVSRNLSNLRKETYRQSNTDKKLTSHAQSVGNFFELSSREKRPRKDPIFFAQKF